MDSLQETYEQKRSEHLKEMQAREERMRQMFVQKVWPLMECIRTVILWHLDSLMKTRNIYVLVISVVHATCNQGIC